MKTSTQPSQRIQRSFLDLSSELLKADMQTLSLLEVLRSLKKSGLPLVDTESLSVFFIDKPTAKQSQAPAEPLP